MTEKRFLTVLIVLCIAVLSLFAVEEKRKVTAYKQTIDNYLPKQMVSVKCLTNDGSDVSKDQILSLSNEFRDNSLLSFKWVCIGNIWGQVDLSLTFGPMLHTENKTDSITYTVSMSHASSKIGNLSVPIDVEPSVTESSKRVYPSDSPSYAGKKFTIIYSDSVDVPSSFTVSTASVTKQVSYDMSENSIVFQRLNGSDNNFDKNNFPGALSDKSEYQNTCESWNRSGNVFVKLDVNEEIDETDDSTHYYTNSGTKECASGWYVATVTITVITG